MAGLSKAIQSFLFRCGKDVDARDKHGHDDEPPVVMAGLVPAILSYG